MSVCRQVPVVYHRGGGYHSGGHVRRWWVLWMPFAGASSEGCSLLVGVGDRCSPPLVSPCWVLMSTVCRGLWWVLVLALALVHVASLRAPVGGGCLDPFVWPCWVLVSAIGGDGGGHSPLFVPLIVCSPLFVWPVACHRCCMSSWLCLLVGSC